MERKPTGPSRFSAGGRRPAENNRADGPRRPGAPRPPGNSEGAAGPRSGSRFSREQENEADALARSDAEGTGGRESFGPPRRRDADADREAYRNRQRAEPGGSARDSEARPRYGTNKFGGGEGNKFGPRKPRPAAPSKEEIIFGTRPVQEALLAGRALERVFVQRGLKSPLGAEVLEAARQLHVPVQEVPLEKLNALTQKQHQGVVAFLPVLEYAPLDEIVRAAFEAGKAPLIVMLDRVTDVRNFGSIARAAECLGADALLIPTRGAAQINGDAVKTSAGALNRLPVAREPNLKETLLYLRAAGLSVVSCTEKAEVEIGRPNSPDLSGPLVLILGSEEDGISPEYLRISDVQVKIPLLGHINSLNVSVAAGVMLYEVQRQRGMV